MIYYTVSVYAHRKRWGAKRLRRILAICLLLITLTACSTATPSPVPPVTAPSTDEVTPTATPAFTLAYSRADSVNPFLMNSRVNRELIPLLYEGLTTVNAAMEAVPCLAESVQVAGTVVTVRLAADVVFSDGTPVVANDVLFSFEAARECDAYAALLSNVSEVAAAEDGVTLTFTLKREDPFAAACLSFPVIRALQDGTVLGSGPYVFDTTPRLLANPHGNAVAFPEIRLLDLVSDDECFSGVELGRVSYFYSDLIDGEVPRVSSAATVVDTEYLVYLGVNASRRLFEEAAVRRAVSIALDRARLAEAAFAGYAAAATSPFPVLFSAANSLAVYATGADRETATSLLSTAGYAVPNERTENTKQASVSLLVCEDNAFKTALADLIKTQLEAVGFAVTVVSFPYDDYFVALRNGRCDLYIGEVRMTANIDLSPWLSRGGAAAYGIDTNGEAAKSYAAFRKGEVTAAEFSAVMAEDVPYIPLCFRRGMAAYARTLTGVTPEAFDAYARPENWKWSTAEK